MNTTSFRSSLIRIAVTLCALAGFVLPVMLDASAARLFQAQVLLETPTLHPPLGPCNETYWYVVDNPDGYDAYLTLNALDPINSTNWAEWLPVLPEAGYYRVEAYIPAHKSITWCSESAPTIEDDTTDARYTIRHALGETTVSRDQSLLANAWLDLGEYFFHAGSGGAVTLTDLNGEAEFTTTVSFSAMRFTWTRQPPHLNLLPNLPRNVLSNPPPPWVDVLAAPAFDVCYLGTNSIPTMQAWWDGSPYRAVGLYLGGISYYEGCSTFTPEWVAQVRAMGWSFLPLWVGPQAPCSRWEHKMDDDPAVTYQQGRAEAEKAAQAARDRGLTNYALGGTIIYYDLEAYSPADEACKLAVGAFLNGWTERLHELNNRSGIYGGDCSTYSATWASLANPPNDVWLAYWDGDGYDPEQSVYDLYCFPDNLYTNHQRVKQYAGEVKEIWGGKSLTIDCDVADGEVAVPEITQQAQNSTLPGAIQQAGWLSAKQGWLVSAGGLYQTADAGESWQRQPLVAVERADLLPNGAAWAAGAGRLYQRSSGEAGWRSQPLPEAVNGWRVEQVSFNQRGEGWLVMQQPTSTIFSIGILLRTTNSGQTWQIEDLPLAGALTWVDARTAWMSGGVAGGELYRTTDGGQSWQAVVLPEELLLARSAVWLGLPVVAADGSLTLHTALSQVKIPTHQVFTSHDGGLSWQKTGLSELHDGPPSAPLPQTASGLYADGARLHSATDEVIFNFDAPVVLLESGPGRLVWAVTRQGSCVGEKGTPNFACSSQDALWLSVDGGESWRQIGS